MEISHKLCFKIKKVYDRKFKPNKPQKRIHIIPPSGKEARNAA